MHPKVVLGVSQVFQGRGSGPSRTVIGKKLLKRRSTCIDKSLFKSKDISALFFITQRNRVSCCLYNFENGPFQLQAECDSLNRSLPCSLILHGIVSRHY